MTTVVIDGITLKRLHFKGNDPSTSSSGMSDSVVWVADATPVDVSLRGGLHAIGAVRGDSHPDFLNLVANSVQSIPTGHGCEISIQYVALEQYDIDIDNPNEPNFIDIDTTFFSASVDIPVFQAVIKTFGTLEPDQYYQRVDNVVSFQYKKSVNRIVLNADVSSDGTVTNQLAIVQRLNEQNNKLHKIGNIWYLFEVDGVERLSKDNYQFTYRWTYDPGVPNTLNLPLEGQFAIQGSYLYPIAWQPGDPASQFVHDNTQSWIIVPHHRTDVAVPSGNPTARPLVNLAPQYLVGSAPGGNGNGYLLLPGVTA